MTATYCCGHHGTVPGDVAATERIPALMVPMVLGFEMLLPAAIPFTTGSFA
ncbi:hypothetical protein DFQ14_10856 [Halopolyspora algeriensis]|uniref:Uncharacterized protein n=1 Tax=Halopolyspora algeriensis TaxID=1500506 RepID=A0A368VMR1_9ACTN|nr:hypothetical protein [Halopolyspora algeriensis]RCW42800.1 hypothetical protein DFQ14_10856 [Halopolyspora algeriensis]TQM56730.1 hypothetical protein FHU43_1544 [Halopolyspora algeriensis]